MKSNFSLFALYLIGFIAFTSQSLLFPVIPLYATALGAVVSEVGLIFAIFAYVMAASMIPFGMLSDRYGRRILLITSLVVSTLAPLLYAMTTNPVQLSVVRAIHGLGFASIAPVSIALVVDLAPSTQRGKALGWYTAATQSGLMVGPVIGGFLLSHFSFEVTFYACSAISLIGLAFIISRYTTFPRKHAVELAIDISRNLFRQRLVLAALLSSLIIAVGAGTIGAYIPIYATDSGINEIGIGFIITASYFTSALLRVPAGMLSDRLGRKPLIIGGIALCAISIACISRFHDLALLSIIALCIGLGWGMTLPSAMALAADLSPTERRGLAMGSFACAFQIGNAVGPTVMGFVAGISDLETMFLVCAAIIAVGFIVIARMLYAR